MSHHNLVSGTFSGKYSRVYSSPQRSSSADINAGVVTSHKRMLRPLSSYSVGRSVLKNCWEEGAASDNSAIWIKEITPLALTMTVLLVLWLTSFCTLDKVCEPVLKCGANI